MGFTIETDDLDELCAMMCENRLPRRKHGKSKKAVHADRECNKSEDREKRQYNNVYDIFHGFENNQEGFISYLRLRIDGKPPERIYVYLTEDDVTITAGGEDKNIVRRIYGK